MLELEGRPLAICPYGSDKKPTCPGGFNAASIDPKAIERLWSLYPGPLVGVATGTASGIAVLDIDIRHKGEAWLAEFDATFGFPATRVHASRSGGLHFIFQHRAGLRSSRELIARGVDVRADGGAVIWWPAAGHRVLCEGPVAPWPAIFDEALAKGKERRSRKTAEAQARYDQRKNAPLVFQGDYRTVPKPLYEKLLKLIPGGSIQRRVRGILSVVTEKVGSELGGEDEGRNDALYWAGRRFRELIADEVIPLEAAEELLLEAARINGYALKDGEGETMDTIHSGLGVATDHKGCIFFPLNGEEEKAE
jgi:hypothetical protein